MPLKANFFQYEDIKYVKISPTLGILYPGVDHLRGFINKVGNEYNYVNYILIDSSKIVSLDYTAIKVSPLNPIFSLLLFLIISRASKTS